MLSGRRALFVGGVQQGYTPGDKCSVELNIALTFRFPLSSRSSCKNEVTYPGVLHNSFLCDLEEDQEDGGAQNGIGLLTAAESLLFVELD